MLRLTPGALTSNRLEQRPAAPTPDLCVHDGVAPTHIDLVVFQSDGPVRRAFTSHEALEAMRQLGEPLWVRIRGLADQRAILQLLERLGVHDVLVEPLLRPPQRPQVDCLEDAVMVVLHRMAVGSDPAELVSDQVAVLLLPGLLVSVEESSAGEPFPALTRWLLSRGVPVESTDLDDILHFLIDDILDDLFPILERISASLDQLEEEVLARPNPQQLNRTFAFRGILRTIRTQVWPLRHQIRMLVRDHHGRSLMASMGIYLFDRDCLVDLLRQTDYQDFGREVFPAAIRAKRVHLHPFDGYWEDIGTIRSYYQCNLDLAGARPPFELACAEAPIYSRGRFLPPSRIDGASIRASLVSDGCLIEQGAVIENSVIGLRCRIGRNVVIRNSVILGNDLYETADDLTANTTKGVPPIGIGEGSVIEGAIIDKNVRIGCRARIVNDHGWDASPDSDRFTVRDGVAVVPKDAVIPDGWVPEPVAAS